MKNEIYYSAVSLDLSRSTCLARLVSPVLSRSNSVRRTGRVSRELGSVSQNSREPEALTGNREEFLRNRVVFPGNWEEFAGNQEAFPGVRKQKIPGNEHLPGTGKYFLVTGKHF